MGTFNISFLVLMVSLAVAVLGLAVRTARLLARPSPNDPSPPKASASRGVTYAFTLGMLPWRKESARRHKFTYLRGVLFHLGIFAFIMLLLLSLISDPRSLPGFVVIVPFLVLGFLAGLIALVSRFFDRNLRVLSRPDDYVSLALVTLTLLVASAYALNISSQTVFWGAVSILCLYIPWSKIPHVVYFFFARNNFGTLFGRRGVLPAPRTGSASGVTR
jgi:nitrate reductase gamma subunit